MNSNVNEQLKDKPKNTYRFIYDEDVNKYVLLPPLVIVWIDLMKLHQQ